MSVSHGSVRIDSVVVTQIVPNRNPLAFSPLSPVSASVGQSGSVTLPATSDPDGQTLTYAIAGALPAGFSFNPATRLLTWSAATLAGTAALTYKADDGHGGSVTSPLSISVGYAANVPLALGNITCSTTAIVLGGSAVCSISPVDPDGIASLAATIDGVPLSVSQNGAVYSVTLAGLAVGNHVLLWSAAGKKPDGSAEAVQTASQSIAVNPAPVQNTAPSALALSNPQALTAGSLAAGQTVGTLGCTDAESGNACTYSTTDTRFVIAGNTLKLAASGALLAAGVYSVPVIARDPQNASYTGAVTVTVNALPNTAPTAITLSAATLTAGSLAVGQSAGTLTCTDLESATCTYALSSQSVPGAFAVASGGAVTVANTTLAAASYSVTVIATDAGGLTRTETKSIAISAAPNQNPNAFSAIAPVTATVGTAGSVTLPSTTDPNGDPLTYSIVGTLPAGFSFNPASRVLSWTAGTAVGTATLTYKADDGK